jgi:L-phenylalanine/L-methionine N-acetyltransferase
MNADNQLAVAFRRAAVTDALEIASLMRDPAVYATLTDLPHPSLEQWRTALSQHNMNEHYICAIADDKLVGYAAIFVQAPMRRRHAGTLTLVVARACWGRGVGAALMSEILNLADDWLNLVRIDLSVYADHERAVALYRRFGFETEGMQRAYALRAGRYADALLMARLHPSLAARGT